MALRFLKLLQIACVGVGLALSTVACTAGDGLSGSAVEPSVPTPEGTPGVDGQDGDQPTEIAPSAVETPEGAPGVDDPAGELLTEPASAADAASSGDAASAPPNPPTLSVARTYGNFTYSWTTPAGEVTGYVLAEALDAGFTQPKGAPTTLGITNSSSQGEGAPCVTRYGRIAAVNSAGTGAWSNVVSAPCPCDVPSAVTGLKIDSGLASCGSTGVKFTWTAPANQRCPITRYNAAVKNASGQTLSTAGLGATTTWTKVLADGGYSVSVTAENILLGAGPASSVSFTCLSPTATTAPPTKTPTKTPTRTSTPAPTATPTPAAVTPGSTGTCYEASSNMNVAFNALSSGQSLLPRQMLVSPDGKYKLTLQADGRLQLFMGTGFVYAVWTKGTTTYPAKNATMNTGGSFVLTNTNNQVTYSSSPSSAGARLAVTNSGKVLVYAGSSCNLVATVQ